MPSPRSDDVQRWDVYDIADELADLPGMVTRVRESASPFVSAWDEVYATLRELEQRLWEASKRAGVVGPYPHHGPIC